MTTPEGLDPTIRTREIVFEADVLGVTPFSSSWPRPIAASRASR
jgi:hypothetical protein